jgi:2-oxoglutarate ferredoxin oxidoreductase subunit beta
MPMRVSELLANLPGTAYIVRRSLHDVTNIRKTKKAILTALKVQQQQLGFSMVEILSTCPTNWGIAPEAALGWIESHMLPQFPLGDYRVSDAVLAAKL